MKSIELDGSSQPPSLADIQEIEKRFGFTFPSEMRQHFLASNGGAPKNPRFNIGDEEYVVNEFFPIKNGDPGFNLEDTLTRLRMSGWFPSHLVPFAGDPGGYFYCVCVTPRAEDFGSVYFYQTDYFDDESRAATRIFATFAEFMAALSK